MSATTDRLMKNIRVHVPGALDSVLLLELFTITKELTQESDLWQNAIALSVVPAAMSYTLTPTDSGVVNRLMSVADPNKSAVPATMQVPGTLLLTNGVSQNQVLTVTVALAVTDPVDTNGYPILPDWIYDKYDDDILDGVLGRVMSQPAKPYTNPQMSAYHLRRWRSALATAASESRRQNVYGAQRWAFPRGFASGGRR